MGRCAREDLLCGSSNGPRNSITPASGLIGVYEKLRIICGAINLQQVIIANWGSEGIWSAPRDSWPNKMNALSALFGIPGMMRGIASFL
jgi:hypothetical protein